MPGGWRRTGLTTAAARAERHGWPLATRGTRQRAKDARRSHAESSVATDRFRAWLRRRNRGGGSAQNNLSGASWTPPRRKSTAPAMGASVPRSSSSARCWACDRIGVRRQAHERPSAMVERLQCRVRTPPTVARRGPSSRDILNGSSMSPELAGWGWSPVRCPRCSQENPGEARFCLHCGAQLAISCPGCGAVQPPGARFCPECGRAVAAAPGAGWLHPGACQRADPGRAERHRG